MGTMALNRIRTWLAACLLVILFSTPGFAADPVESDMQLFAPAEDAGYGGGVRANEGFFALVDFIQWNISKPYTTSLGDNSTRIVYVDPTNPANPTIESNSLNTSFIDAEATVGERFQVGSIDDGQGFMVSGWNLHTQSENFTYSGVNMVFQAPTIPGSVNNSPPSSSNPLGGTADLLQGYLDTNTATGHIVDLPVNFDTLEIKNAAAAYRIDVDYIRRAEPTEHCGTFEWYCGAGYMNFSEWFDVTAPNVPATTNPPTATAPTPGGILNDSYWYTHAVNSIVAPR